MKITSLGRYKRCHSKTKEETLKSFWVTFWESFIGECGKHNHGPHYVNILITGTWERELRLIISWPKTRLSWITQVGPTYWEVSLEVEGSGSKKETWRPGQGQRGTMWEGHNLLMVTLKGRKGPGTKEVHSLWKQRHKDTHSPLEPPERTWCCWHTDFRPVKPILEFWPLEL